MSHLKFLNADVRHQQLMIWKFRALKGRVVQQ